MRDSRAAVLADLVGPAAGVGAGVLAEGVHAWLDGFVPRLGSEAQFPEEGAPNTLDESTLRETVGRHWIVDELRRSTITVVFPPVQAPNVDTDDRGRSRLPAFLLSAHLPG